MLPDTARKKDEEEKEGEKRGGGMKLEQVNGRVELF